MEWLNRPKTYQAVGQLYTHRCGENYNHYKSNGASDRSFDGLIWPVCHIADTTKGEFRIVQDQWLSKMLLLHFCSEKAIWVYTTQHKTMSKIASPFAKWSNKDHRITKVDVALLDQNISAIHHHSVMIKIFLDAKTFWGLPIFSSEALWKWVKTHQKLLPQHPGWIDMSDFHVSQLAQSSETPPDVVISAGKLMETLTTPSW